MCVTSIQIRWKDMYLHVFTISCALILVLVWPVPLRYLGDRVFLNPPQTGVQLQVFPTCQQVADGVKLWTVTHQLVDSLHLCQHTENHTNTQFNTSANTADINTRTTEWLPLQYTGTTTTDTYNPSTCAAAMFINDTTVSNTNTTVRIVVYC